MKELSIEQKARAYDKSLGRAKEYLNSPRTCFDIDQLYNIFPILREDDNDENVRKALISFLKSPFVNENITDEKVAPWLDWLEKQGEPKEYTFKSLPRLLDMIEPTSRTKAYCQKLIDTLAKEGYNTDAKIVKEILKGWNGDDVPMAVMDEQKPYGQREECLDCQFNYAGECKGSCAMKRSERNPINKEPKFKVGNWYQCTKDFFGKGVTFDKNTTYYCAEEGCLQDEYGCHIAIVKDLYDNFKLWTIQDARNGDVLCTYECGTPKIIFILKGTPKKHYALGYHCYYNIMYPHFESDSKKGCLSPNDEDVKPATKEQRDLLFQKMHEAGYEWDANNKELNKIHIIDEDKAEIDYCFTKMMNGEKVSSTLSEEDEDMLQAFKNRVIPQPKQEWDGTEIAPPIDSDVCG